MQMPEIESRRLDSVEWRRRARKGSGAPDGEWPRHMPTTVDGLIYGMGRSSEDPGTSKEVWRGKGSGAPEGVWPRHMPSSDLIFQSESEDACASVEEVRRGKGSGAVDGAWPRHMRSDVDRIVFGRDMDGSEEVEDAQMPSIESRRLDGTRRGKGSGAADGAWPRHMRSDVDRIVFGRDMDGSEEVEDGHVHVAPVSTRRPDPPVAMSRPARSIPSTSAMPPSYAPPSASDLFALHRLYGGNRARITQFFASQWGADPAAIAPLVHSWLEMLPPVEMLPLPSRSRSSPALPAIAKRHAAAAPQGSITLDRGVLSYTNAREVPAATAPIHASSTSPARAAALATALSGLHSASVRLSASANPLSSTKASAHGGRSNAASAQIYTLHEDSVDFSPIRLSRAAVAAVPEDAPVEDGDDAALKAFMARARLRGEIAPDMQLARRAAATLARSWRMRTGTNC